jgi:hypothetical protein
MEMVACNNPVTPRLNILLNPMPSASSNDRVVLMNISYDRIELSCDEPNSLHIPKEYNSTIRTDSQLRAIFKSINAKNKRNGTKTKVCAYREIYEAPHGMRIRKDLVYEGGFSERIVNVCFNGARHSGIAIRQYMETIFPDDWRRFRLHYYEVACDFNVDVQSFIERGLYRSYVRTKEEYKGTRYLGSRRSKKRTISYDKKEERLFKGYDPDHYGYRLEERNRLRAVERPLVEDWLSGRWRPKVFTHTYIGNTSIRWDGLKDNEWASIMRNGFQSALRSRRRTDARQAKMRKLIKKHQWFPLRRFADQGLLVWTLRYRLEYGISPKYTGIYAKVHWSQQAKQGLNSAAVYKGRGENSEDKSRYHFDDHYFGEVS